jgi:hypothetical protein
MSSRMTVPVAEAVSDVDGHHLEHADAGLEEAPDQGVGSALGLRGDGLDGHGRALLGT